MRPHVRYTLLVLTFLLLTGGCGGPEERKANYLAKAQGYIRDGNLPKARVALRNVLKIDPKDAEAYYFFAEVEEKEKNWKNAFGNYMRVVELVPDHERALLKLARFYLEGGMTDKVLELTAKVLAKTPNQVEAQTLVIAVIHARRDPRQRLPNRPFLIGLRFCEPFSCNLDIEVSRVGESQDSREVDPIVAAVIRR